MLTDETYKQEVVSETKSDFLKEVHNKRVDLGLIKDEPYTPENDNNNNKKEEGSKGEEGNEAEDNKQNSNSEDEITNDSNKKEKSPKVKKIYREIVKKTHPDKDKTEKYIDLYKEATSAYEKNDIVALIFICSKLDIEIDLEEDDMIRFQMLTKELLRINSDKQKFIDLYPKLKDRFFKNKEVFLNLAHDVKKQDIEFFRNFIIEYKEDISNKPII